MMGPGRVISPWWKRRIVRVFAVLAATPFVLLALLNLLLATPWPRGWIAGKISARTGLDARVGRASWTPWGGAFAGDLSLRQARPLRDTVKEPFLSVRGIRVFPRWDRLIRGKPDVSRIRIDRPRLVVPLEMVVSVISSSAPEVIAGEIPPAVAAVAEPPTPPAHGHRAVPAPASPVASEPAVARDSSTAWLEVEDGGAEVLLGGGKLLKVSGLRGSIPVAGDPAASQFHIGSIESLGRVLASEIVLPLAWKAPELRAVAPDLRIAGIQVQFAAVLGVVRGAPFGVEIAVPTQAADGTPFAKSLQPVAERVQARIVGQGFLRFPSTWQGIAEFGAEHIRVNVASQPVDFDGAHGLFVLKASQLHCPDIRLTGERMSFLGNGHFGPDGQGAAVLRAVVPPDLAEAWAKRLAVAGEPAVFRPLETPDRQFIDLRWVSFPDGHGIELGAGGPVVPIGQVRQLVSSPAVH